MFSLRDTLASRPLPKGYNKGMGILVLCGNRPVSITCLRNSPCPESFVVHFKSVIPIDSWVDKCINQSLIAMQRLFAKGNIAVLRGTTEDLSDDPNTQSLQDLYIGAQGNTKDVDTLIGYQNYVGYDDVIIYIVKKITMAPTALGDSPDGTTIEQINGAAVIAKDDPWVIPHEIGHILGLPHIDYDPKRLMFPIGSEARWTNWEIDPLVLSTDEYLDMKNSGITKSC